MIKITAYKVILTILIIMIISTVALILNSFGLIGSRYIFVALIGILFFGICFAGIFAGINESKGIRKKFLTGLIGNIILNFLSLIALFYVVLTMIK